MWTMVKAKLCGATTKKGVRCKNPGKEETSGLCGVHSGDVKPAVNAPREIQPTTTRFEKIERGFKVAGSVGSTGGGIYTLIKVIEYVGNHWPQIQHVFHYIHHIGRISSFSEVKVMVERGTVSPYQLAHSFESWFYRLPKYVQDETQREFGDVRELIASVRGPR